jgi:hypothetical protein
MPFSKFIRNIALVGGTGRVGKAILASLLDTGKHTVTVLTREGSKTIDSLPPGAKGVSINYDDPSSLISVLKGQDALVISLAATAPPDTQSKLINAAGEAGVGWILPNEWSPDSTHDGLRKDVTIFQKLANANAEIKTLGKSKYVAVTCGFWYEWSLGLSESFGIDLVNHKAVLFDNGETKMSVSTWAQVGRAVAALLSFPVEDEDHPEKSLQHYANQNVCIASFTLSQRDMLASAYRVTGTKESDWSISTEPAVERYQKGVEAMKAGDRMGFVRSMYTRVFYPDDSGDYEKRHGLLNGILGLPKESLDEATEKAVERARTNPWA